MFVVSTDMWFVVCENPEPIYIKWTGIGNVQDGQIVKFLMEDQYGRRAVMDQEFLESCPIRKEIVN